ncbi:hypothetical protein [Kozakia baliensis]|uniref:hypothetical protein n=1 Tax=Kozakia baliensis TaxID=153496 RepID=UPI001D04EC25|nr:hypothetical protein [Kozakia baliensis]
MRAIITLFWANPGTVPPPGVETLPDGRTWWCCTLLDYSHPEELAIRAAHAPPYVLGSGWSQGWTPVLAPPKRWSGARKAQTRRRNLRRRLEAAVPLFAGQFEAEELARRPGYFDAQTIEAENVRSAQEKNR